MAKETKGILVELGLSKSQIKQLPRSIADEAAMIDGTREIVSKMGIGDRKDIMTGAIAQAIEIFKSALLEQEEVELTPEQRKEIEDHKPEESREQPEGEETGEEKPGEEQPGEDQPGQEEPKEEQPEEEPTAGTEPKDGEGEPGGDEPRKDLGGEDLPVKPGGGGGGAPLDLPEDAYPIPDLSDKLKQDIIDKVSDFKGAVPKWTYDASLEIDKNEFFGLKLDEWIRTWNILVESVPTFEFKYELMFGERKTERANLFSIMKFIWEQAKGKKTKPLDRYYIYTQYQDFMGFVLCSNKFMVRKKPFIDLEGGRGPVRFPNYVAEVAALGIPVKEFTIYSELGRRMELTYKPDDHNWNTMMPGWPMIGEDISMSNPDIEARLKYIVKNRLWSEGEFMQFIKGEEAMGLPPLSDTIKITVPGKARYYETFADRYEKLISFEEPNPPENNVYSVHDVNDEIQAYTSDVPYVNPGDYMQESYTTYLNNPYETLFYLRQIMDSAELFADTDMYRLRLGPQFANGIDTVSPKMMAPAIFLQAKLGSTPNPDMLNLAYSKGEWMGNTETWLSVYSLNTKIFNPDTTKGEPRSFTSIKVMGKEDKFIIALPTIGYFNPQKGIAFKPKTQPASNSALKKAILDLESDYDRMSSSGQEIFDSLKDKVFLKEETEMTVEELVSELQWDCDRYSTDGKVAYAKLAGLFGLPGCESEPEEPKKEPEKPKEEPPKAKPIPLRLRVTKSPERMEAEEQIKALKAALKYAPKNEKEIIKAQIEAMQTALKYM